MPIAAKVLADRVWREWDVEMAAFTCPCGLPRHALAADLRDGVVLSCGHKRAGVSALDVLRKTMPAAWLADYLAMGMGE